MSKFLSKEYRIPHSSLQAFKAWQSRMQKERTKPLVDYAAAKVLEDYGFNLEDIPFRPRSLYDPQQIFTTFERFTSDHTKYEEAILKDRNFEYGIRVARRIFSNPHRTVGKYLPVEFTPEIYLDMTKSAGLPTLRHKNQVDLLKLHQVVAEIRARKRVPQPCVAQARTQKNNKTRLVWGYPFEMTYLEQMYAGPLISMFNRKKTPMTTGTSKISLSCRIGQCDYQENVIALDYSKFDTSIPRVLIHEAFSIIKTWFSSEFHSDIDIIERYFVFTPIVLPDGKLHYGKNHGVPSGSSFTQFVDSVVNVMLNFAMDRRFNLKLKSKHLFVLGDDVLAFPGKKVDKPLLSKMSKWLAGFGFIINEDKTEIGQIHYLGANWISGLRHRPQEEVVCNIVFPETIRRYTRGDVRAGAEMVVKATLVDTVNNAGLLVNKKRWGWVPVQDNAFSWLDGDESHFHGYMRFLYKGKLKDIQKSIDRGDLIRKSSVIEAYLS